MVYLRGWLDWQWPQKTRNLWRYSKNNSEYQDFINIRVVLYRMPLEIKIQQCPTCKMGIFTEFLNHDGFCSKIISPEKLMGIFFWIFLVTISGRTFIQESGEISCDTWFSRFPSVFSCRNSLNILLFYTCFRSFLQNVVFKICRGVHLWTSVESSRTMKIWIV
jgi:hypothetical protein